MEARCEKGQMKLSMYCRQNGFMCLFQFFLKKNLKISQSKAEEKAQQCV